MFKKLLLVFPLVISTNIFAQDSESASDVEEVVTVGSQIKGAKITGALPVTVISTEDIEGIGVESGDELFAELAEMGSNNFNQTDFSGGYNASRGDVGSLDLRNIGTGNTLTLLNGRRLVQSPGYATEWLEEVTFQFQASTQTLFRFMVQKELKSSEMVLHRFMVLML